MTPTAILAAAKLAATRSGDYALAQSMRRHDANSIDRNDVKHKLDVECEALCRDILSAATPGSALLGEESCEVWDGPLPRPPSGLEWIVDPIDGTINFFHGDPNWCCSVAARLDGQTVAGVVYAPELRLCYEASIDGPALCNGAPIAVSDDADPTLALIRTGKDKSQSHSDYMGFIDAVDGACQRTRTSGSAALDVAAVAHGHADGYVQLGIYLWDIAAAALVVERAGGRCETLASRGGYRMSFMATNGAPEIGAALRRCLPRT